MAIQDDILSMFRRIGDAGDRATRRGEAGLAILDQLTPMERMQLSSMYNPEQFSSLEEAMTFNPLIGSKALDMYQARAGVPLDTALDEMTLPTSRTGLSSLVSEPPASTVPIPKTAPRMPVSIQPLPSLDTEDILTLEELGSIRRGVQSDIANQRQRYEEEQARENMSPADFVQSRVLQRPRLGGVGKSPVEETVTNLAVGMGLGIGQNDNLNTLINMIGAEDPQLANYITEGVKEGAIGTASSILSVVSAPVLASLATRFLNIRPEVAIQIARDPVRGKLLRDELGRFISPRSVGPQTRQQQFGSAGQAQRALNRRGTEYDPKMVGPGSPTAMARGGNVRDAIMNRYNRMV